MAKIELLAMVPMLPIKLSKDQQHRLLALARASIGHAFVNEGLAKNRALEPVSSEFELGLQVDAACFVTLTSGGALRGCVGTLEAQDTLINNVAKYAYNAAFSDPRFAPLEEDELEKIVIEISVLSPKQRLEVANEKELFGCLNPNIDGLCLKDGSHHATFLPQVWEKLPTATQFVSQLKLKAGLAEDYWSDELCWSVYQVFCFQEG